MGCAATDSKTTPELLWSLCHEAILRELRWLLLHNPHRRPDLTLATSTGSGYSQILSVAENSDVKVN